MTNLGTEYSNDSLSYRDARAWEDIWDQSLQGFRSSAGSLNQKDFLFNQSIKFTSSTKESWRLAYQANRVEEPRRILDESELELCYGSDQDRWRLGLQVEGQTEKSFVDLGISLSHQPDEKAFWHYRTRTPLSWKNKSSSKNLLKSLS